MPHSEQAVLESLGRGQSARLWLTVPVTEGGFLPPGDPGNREMNAAAQRSAATQWLIPSLKPKAHLAGRHRASKGHWPVADEGCSSRFSSCRCVHGSSPYCPPSPSPSQPVALVLSLNTPGPLSAQDSQLQGVPGPPHAGPAPEGFLLSGAFLTELNDSGPPGAPSVFRDTSPQGCESLMGL